MELELITTSQNYHVLQEEQRGGKAVIICTANGQPVQMIESAEHPKQILVPVKKGRIVMIGTKGAFSDEIFVLRVRSTYSCKGQYYAVTDLLNIFRDGKWQNPLPASFSSARDVLLKKMHSTREIVFAAQPVLLPVRQSKKGYAVLDEECGAECSTIVCCPDGIPAKAVYIYQRSHGESGKQAVVEIGPRYRVLRGKRTQSGYEIYIYIVERLGFLSGQRVAEASLINKCVDGHWQHGLPVEMRPLISTLIDKIEGNDTETIISKMR